MKELRTKSKKKFI